MHFNGNIKPFSLLTSPTFDRTAPHSAYNIKLIPNSQSLRHFYINFLEADNKN